MHKPKKNIKKISRCVSNSPRQSAPVPMYPTWEVRRGGEEVALSVVPAAAGGAAAAVALRQRRRRRRGREVGQVEGDRLAWLHHE